MPEFDATIRYSDTPRFYGYNVGTDGSVWTRWRTGRIAGSRQSESGRFLVTAWRSLNPYKTGRGYMSVRLCTCRRVFRVKVHRLVLEAFVGPCPPGKEGCHNDGDRLNNTLSNLRWDTPSANRLEAYKHGALKSGQEHSQARYSDAQVREARAMRKAGSKLKEIAAHLGCSLSHAGRLILGQCRGE